MADIGDASKGELLVHLGMGQSLLALTPYLRPLAGASGPLDARRAWVFAAKGDPRIVGQPLRGLPEDALAALYPHRRTPRSGPLTIASQAILAHLKPEDQLLTVNLAQKGARIGDFRPDSGTAGFRNLERCLSRAVALADARGLRCQRLVVSWVQGQADRRAQRSRYRAILAALINEVEALFRQVAGPEASVLFCLSQLTATDHPGLRSVPLAQSDLPGLDPARCIMAGPEYMLERSDGTHLKPRSAFYLGALHGRAVGRWVQGADWQPLAMDRAEVDGTHVRVSFSGGVGPLEPEPAHGFDRTRGVGVRPLPHLGFRWLDRGAAEATLVDASITGPREVRLTLSHAPRQTEDCRLLLGFPDGIGSPEGFVKGTPALARGGATNLRTAGEAVPGLGLHLQDWALQQVIGVTPVQV